MWAQGISAIVTALRGGIIAIFCALTVLLVVIPAHAADASGSGSVVAIEAVLTNAADDESEVRPDLVPCHGAGQFCGHVALVRPFTLVTKPSSESRLIGLCLAPAHALAPGPSERLAKPPRA
jgi:hypothetical protein